MDLSERITKALGRDKMLSQAGLARACGIARASVNGWASGKTDSIDGKHLTTAAAYLGVTPHWLSTGKGPMLPTEPAPQMTATSGPAPVVEFPEDGDLLITQYEAGGAMGHGLELEERQPGVIKSWRVDHEWLRLNVRHHTGVSNLCIVTGFGPSMQPKYNPGDPLLMDRGVTMVETEGIFFFRVANHGYIKQLQRIPTEDGLIIRAKSLNKDYDPFDITKKMDFEVFGKILTVWRSELL